VLRTRIQLSSPGLTGRPSIPETAMGTRQFYVYILASRIGGTLYIGVTNDLVRRVGEHKLKIAESFTKRYEVIRLVYFEVFDQIEQAIHREKRLKKWSRAWKISLIEKENPNWIDLYLKIAGGGG
jgi:putative endonuclease